MMAIRRRSLRRMTPLARDIAKVSNELQSLKRKLVTLAGKVQDLEIAFNDYERASKA